MDKQFYNKVVNDLEAIKKRKVSNAPATQKQLNDFRREAIEMLEIVNGSKKYEPVKMTTQRGFTAGRYELKLNKLINK